ncbi:MAG: hypothetical protein JWN17_355 [Frankiales bacterium]|nr:hypothetical protein [Frankiales bacterium]
MSTPGGDVLAQLWAQVAHVAQSRVAVLERALHAVLAAAPEARELCGLAVEECHKLVGSLDSYGRAGGSALALQAARALEGAQPDLAELRAAVAALRRLVGGTEQADA